LGATEQGIALAKKGCCKEQLLHSCTFEKIALSVLRLYRQRGTISLFYNKLLALRVELQLTY
jgi:hypothetical protein